MRLYNVSYQQYSLKKDYGIKYKMYVIVIAILNYIDLQCKH